MRVIPSLILVAASFGAGAAVAQYAAHHHPAAEPSAAQAAPAPGSTEGARDSQADLQGQMMWDPNTGTYQGG